MAVINRKWQTIIAFLVATMTLVSGWTFSTINNQKNGEEIEADVDPLAIIYDSNYLGYHSTSFRQGIYGIGFSKDYKIPILINDTFIVYSYTSVNITEEYTKNIINTTFPELKIEDMNLSVEYPALGSAPYVALRNDTYCLKLFRHGGLIFDNHSSFTITYKDAVGNDSNAIKIAKQFLSDHGGVPDDISSISTTYGTLLDTNGVEYPAYYIVFIERKIGNYSIHAGSLRNQIMMKINCCNGEVLIFKKHWPTLNEDFILDKEDIPPVQDILAFYGMNSQDEKRYNITNYRIEYMVPFSIQLIETDAWADTYYLAPYLFIQVSNGGYYILGLVEPGMSTTAR